MKNSLHILFAVCATHTTSRVSWSQQYRTALNFLPQRHFVLATVLAVLVSTTGPARAIIIGGGVTGGVASDAGGTFIELSVPFGTTSQVGEDNFNDFNLYAFNEDQNIVLTLALSIDVGPSPISSGTTVASHYVFYDPPGELLSPQSQIGFVDFDAPILGIITKKDNLDQSDLLLNNNVDYESPDLRGLEGGDSVSVDPSKTHRLRVNWSASTPGDYIRVLTSESAGGNDPCSNNPPGIGGCAITTVPEPSTTALVALGLVGIGVGVRRRVDSSRTR